MPGTRRGLPLADSRVSECERGQGGYRHHQHHRRRGTNNKRASPPQSCFCLHAFGSLIISFALRSAKCCGSRSGGWETLLPLPSPSDLLRWYKFLVRCASRKYLSESCNLGKDSAVFVLGYYGVAYKTCDKAAKSSYSGVIESAGFRVCLQSPEMTNVSLAGAQ